MNLQQKLSYTLFLGVLVSFSLAAQSEWGHYLTRGDSHDMVTHNDTAYIANESGLLIIDMKTHEETLIHPGNHAVEVQGFKEVELGADGHLWLLSNNDRVLYLYDGHTFELHCDSLQNINNLIFANDKLWFFTSSILFQSDLYSLENNQCINHGNRDIYAATSDSQGRFWYAAEDTIKQFDGQQVLETIAIPFSLYQMSDYLIDATGRQWLAFGTPIPNLLLFENGVWQETFSSTYLTEFFEPEPGKVSARLVDNTYVEFNGVNETVVDLFSGFPNEFSVLSMESTDSIWYTSELNFRSSRLFGVYPDTTIEYLANEDIIPGNIAGLKKDCDGNLVTSNGTFINKRINDSWQMTPLATQADRCYYGGFAEDSQNCELWVASRYISAARQCRSVWQFKDNVVTEYNMMLPEQHSTIYQDRHNSLYYTTNNPTEIHKIDSLGSETIIPVPDSPGIRNLFFLDSDEMLAVSYRDTTIRIFEDNNWNHLDLSSLGLDQAFLGVEIYEDSEGDLWFNEAKGLIKYDGVTLTYFPMIEEFADTYRTYMIEDKYESYWMTVHGKGLLRWTPDSTYFYNTSNSDLLSNQASRLEIVNDYLWVNHFHGLTKIKIDPLTTSTTEPTAVHNITYSIYPNPSLGKITITNPSRNKRQIAVITLSGKIISNQTSSAESWTTFLEPGIYLVRLTESSTEFVEKIVILE